MEKTGTKFIKIVVLYGPMIHNNMNMGTKAKINLKKVNKSTAPKKCSNKHKYVYQFIFHISPTLFTFH